MNETICIDASLVVAILIPERYTEPAIQLWEQWINLDNKIVSPALLGYEVTSAIYRKAVQKKISYEDGHSAIDQFLQMDIEIHHLPELHIIAFDSARQFDRPNTYDAHYLALARHWECPLWTADERFYNSVKDKNVQIHYIGEG